MFCCQSHSEVQGKTTHLMYPKEGQSCGPIQTVFALLIAGPTATSLSAPGPPRPPPTRHPQPSPLPPSSPCPRARTQPAPACGTPPLTNTAGRSRTRRASAVFVTRRALAERGLGTAVDSRDVLKSECVGGVVLLCTGDASYLLLGGHTATLCEGLRNGYGGRRCGRRSWTAMIGDCLAGSLTRHFRR
ncbi:hypothetical protein FA95DRAFT_1566413 [Auriscalpium vulgare]|uniref:Uncharacterized protein n=1 Tax=Auriscalpium vulgare TaxID=40419 RepID=A0ACB8R8S8_9AGAM|nr:hypothetical protein FA95DRAFT_1566413 [Auriscalpium vulgare]